MNRDNFKVGSFDEALDNTTVTDYFIDGKCSECGSCCTRYLALNNKEINTIRAYIKRHNIIRQQRPVNVYKNKLFDMVCPFLDDSKPNHKCSIYEVRPLICREFTCRKDFIPSNELMTSNRRKVDVTELFFGNE